MNEDDLWNTFNLAKANEDPGGGILYCLRYSSEKINAMQENIVSFLKKSGVEMIDQGEGIGAKIDKNLLNPQKAYLLLEELSVLNEAKEWIGAGMGDLQTISKLKSHFITTYFYTLNRNKVDAYNLVDVIIPNICRDIACAHQQNRVLSSRSKKDLGELFYFSKKQIEHLNDPRGYVVFGL